MVANISPQSSTRASYYNPPHIAANQLLTRTLLKIYSRHKIGVHVLTAKNGDRIALNIINEIVVQILI